MGGTTWEQDAVELCKKSKNQIIIYRAATNKVTANFILKHFFNYGDQYYTKSLLHAGSLSRGFLFRETHIADANPFWTLYEEARNTKYYGSITYNELASKAKVDLVSKDYILDPATDPDLWLTKPGEFYTFLMGGLHKGLDEKLKNLSQWSEIVVNPQLENQAKLVFLMNFAYLVKVAFCECRLSQLIFEEFYEQVAKCYHATLDYALKLGAKGEEARNSIYSPILISIGKMELSLNLHTNTIIEGYESLGTLPPGEEGWKDKAFDVFANYIISSVLKALPGPVVAAIVAVRALLKYTELKEYKENLERLVAETERLLKSYPDNVKGFYNPHKNIYTQHLSEIYQVYQSFLAQESLTDFQIQSFKRHVIDKAFLLEDESWNGGSAYWQGILDKALEVVGKKVRVGETLRVKTDIEPLEVPADLIFPYSPPPSGPEGIGAVGLDLSALIPFVLIGGLLILGKEIMD